METASEQSCDSLHVATVTVGLKTANQLETRALSRIQKDWQNHRSLGCTFKELKPAQTSDLHGERKGIIISNNKEDNNSDWYYMVLKDPSIEQNRLEKDTGT